MKPISAFSDRRDGSFRWSLGLILAVVIGVAAMGRAAQAEPIVIATSKSGWLVWLAEDQGFFKRAGVDVKVELVASGVAAGAGLINGKYQFATMSEYAFAARSFEHPELRVTGTVAAISNVRLIGRRSAGVNGAADLPGKSIGLRAGSISQFFLGRLLDLNGIRATDVKTVDIAPPKLPEALGGRAVDTIISWEPYANQAAELLGKDGIAITVQGGQPYFFVLAATAGFIGKRTADVEKVVRALVHAADWAGASREYSMDILSGRMGVDRAVLEKLWSDHVMDVSLSQDMLSLMEDEAHWRVENGLSKGEIPNFLERVYPDALLAVDPTRFTIIR